LIAAVLGLFSSVHCIGMCGGIASALTLGVPEADRASAARLLSRVIAYNLGRMLSYAIAGALSATVFSTLPAVMPQAGHQLLAVVAGAMLVSIGLHLAGWFPALRRIESLGAGLWRRLQPYTRMLMPVRSAPQALLLGTLWGWLPCGLVYSTLVWSAASADPLRGALYMMLFGLGTVPAIATAGMLAGGGVAFTRKTAVRRGAGVVLVAVGALSIGANLQHVIVQYCLA
jgi:sulfite exporter TauE/SafE